MPIQPTRSTSRWICVLAVALAGIACRDQPVVQSPPLPAPQAAPLQAALEAGQARRYSVALKSDDYLRVFVERVNGDLALSLLDPEGDPLAWTKDSDDAQTLESIDVVASQSGLHQVVVEADSYASGSVRYRIWTEDLRPATPLDRIAAAAFQAQSEARRRDREGNQEALRSALPLYRRSVDLWKEARREREQAQALKQLARVCRLLGEVREQLESVRQAIELFRGLGDPSQEMDLLVTLGEIHHHRRETGPALEAWKTALRLAERFGDRAGEASALTSLGVFSRSQGESQRALEYYRQALEIYESLGEPRQRALVLENTGVLHSEAGKYELALDFFERALEAYRALETRYPLESRRDQAYVLTQIGWVRSLQGAPGKAVESYLQALELRKSAEDQTGNTGTLGRLGTAYRKMGEFDKALESYRSSLKIARQTNQKSSQASTLANIGELFLDRGEPGEALKYLGEATALLHDSPDLGSQAHVKFLYAKAQRDLGRFPEAKDLAGQALRDIETIRLKAPGRTLRAAYWASRYDYNEFYVDLLMRMHRREPDRGYDAEAFQAAQISRAKGLLEALGQSDRAAARLANPELAEHLRLLEGRVRQLVRERSRTGDPDTRLAVDRKVRELLLEMDLVQDDIRTGEPLPRPTQEPSPLPLAEIQNRLLDSDTVLLAFFLGKEQSFLWFVGPKAFTSHTLPKSSEIETRARGFYDLLARSHRAIVQRRVESEAEVLGQMLLGPVAGRLGRARLLVAADGILHCIPFGALSVASEAGRPPRALILDHEIVNVPSMPYLGRLRRQRSRRPAVEMTLAVFADPVFTASDDRVFKPSNSPGPDGSGQGNIPARDDSDGRPEAGEWDLSSLPRLPASRLEAELISAMLPARQVHAAFGFEASREALLKEPLDHYRIVHLATHGLLYPKLEGLSGVALSMVDRQGNELDGFLPANEVFNLSLSADLVVVSACKSALGSEVRGEGLVGLTHGFLNAGAAAVVVSLWNVNDYASAQLMKLFYEKMLGSGLAPAAALRAAQLEMSRTTHFEKPYFWAGFVLQGDWR